MEALKAAGGFSVFLDEAALVVSKAGGPGRPGGQEEEGDWRRGCSVWQGGRLAGRRALHPGWQGEGQAVRRRAGQLYRADWL